MTATMGERGESHSALLDQLDAQVRSVVRHEGVDPQREPALVRRIAESVVREHDERSLTGAVAPVPDAKATVGELIARVSGFGPLQPFLEDPEIEEIWINDPTRVFVARKGKHELTNLMLSQAQVNELVERMLKSSGRRIDISQPFVDAMLPGLSVGSGRGQTRSTVGLRRFHWSRRCGEVGLISGPSPRRRPVNWRRFCGFQLVSGASTSLAMRRCYREPQPAA